MIFTLYTADVIRIAHTFGVNVHCYADDLQLYVHCRANEAAAAVARLIACIAVIETWMGFNLLKMNSEKTQFIWLGSQNRAAGSYSYCTSSSALRNFVIAPSTNICNIGAIFNSEMTMSDHINSVTRTCFYQLRQLSFVRRFLSANSTRIGLLVHAFVSSRVDYCNSLLCGAGAHAIRKLQAMLNAAARLIILEWVAMII